MKRLAGLSFSRCPEGHRGGLATTGMVLTRYRVARRQQKNLKRDV